MRDDMFPDADGAGEFRDWSDDDAERYGTDKRLPPDVREAEASLEPKDLAEWLLLREVRRQGDRTGTIRQDALFDVALELARRTGMGGSWEHEGQEGDAAGREDAPERRPDGPCPRCGEADAWRPFGYTASKSRRRWRCVKCRKTVTTEVPPEAASAESGKPARTARSKPQEPLQPKKPEADLPEFLTAMAGGLSLARVAKAGGVSSIAAVEISLALIDQLLDREREIWREAVEGGGGRPRKSAGKGADAGEAGLRRPRAEDVEEEEESGYEEEFESFEEVDYGEEDGSEEEGVDLREEEASPGEAGEPQVEKALEAYAGGHLLRWLPLMRSVAAYHSTNQTASALGIGPRYARKLRRRFSDSLVSDIPRTRADVAKHATCPHCGKAGQVKDHGTTPHGTPRRKCYACGKTFTVATPDQIRGATAANRFLELLEKGATPEDAANASGIDLDFLLPAETEIRERPEPGRKGPGRAAEEMIGELEWADDDEGPRRGSPLARPFGGMRLARHLLRLLIEPDPEGADDVVAAVVERLAATKIWLRRSRYKKMLPAVLKGLVDGGTSRSLAAANGIPKSTILRMVWETASLLSEDEVVAETTEQSPTETLDIPCPRCGLEHAALPHGTIPDGRRRYLCVSCGRLFVQAKPEAPAEEPVSGSTARDMWMNLLRAVAAGRTIREIAQDLGVRELQVSVPRRRFFEAIGQGDVKDGEEGDDAGNGPPETCPYCNGNDIVRYGKFRNGRQKYACGTCGKMLAEDTAFRIAQEWQRRVVAGKFLEYLERGDRFEEAARDAGVDLVVMVRGRRKERAAK
jgi:transposase-like protein